ncbi:ATP-binding protein [Natronosporangium hydrolyticum]|uniref:ATP-binding protein n=2 Tax=Natronosporangium hydrolyticum TaxID=2811111 RepID=A0A895YGS6_9ACTN|nr:ATP-binding protein [Natronosporangium hydrolyticum]
MDGFVGRQRELAALDRMLGRVVGGGRAGRPGRALLMRGRRRVGKSRLVEEFVARAGVPHLYFTASAAPSLGADLGLFQAALEASDLPGAAELAGQAPQTWDAALQLLASVLPVDGPSIVVLDELPYLIANDPGLEGTLQKVFDRALSRRPVLLIGIGSDLAMMEALNEYGRPFHQRATELVVPPLNPGDVATLLGLPPAEAFDAYLVSGGLPLILDDWPAGATVPEYLSEVVADPTSALLVSGERAVAAEFPVESQARSVLAAIGAGERSFTSIGRAAGGLPQASLSRALDLLTAKRVVATTTPLSTRPSRETRYAVADPYLRFWLAFLGPYAPEIERGRGDLTLARMLNSWAAWRGRAIEPVIRESLLRLPELLPADTGVVGGYWTRSGDPEIDLVGADRGPVAGTVSFVGSVKWQEQRPFDARDLGRLVAHRRQLPGADEQTPLLVVSRTGASVAGVPVVGAAELLAAYPVA